MNIIFCLLFGTFGALYQIKIKKFLAFSGISNMGFILIGFLFYSFESLYGLIFYLIVYTLQVLLFFLFILFIRDKSTNLNINKLNQLETFSLNNKILAYIFAINLFAMAGIPPLIGFFSKFYLFNVLVTNNSYYLIFFFIITSCISTFYYIRIVQILFFKNNNKPKFYETFNYSTTLLIIILTYINIFFCICPWILMDLIYDSIIEFFKQISLSNTIFDSETILTKKLYFNGNALTLNQVYNLHMLLNSKLLSIITNNEIDFLKLEFLLLELIYENNETLVTEIISELKKIDSTYLLTNFNN